MQKHGFTLLRDQSIPEINTRARIWRHDRTGAQLISMENDDENKVFGIVFATPTSDSTGLPHILEHAVLCGSRKYPVKDPFVQLAKGSLNTFLNAFTYPDKTCYPVASQNLQDFYNLIDVYLDAVFYPRITPDVLEQEGWHYELEDLAAPLIYKGVVFNEMKGAYSSPDNLLGRHSERSLFPDTIYGNDAGGDPRVIPDLTYEAFKRFHETYYHPSNARIWFYGDDDPDERLRLVDAFITGFAAAPVRAEMPLQPRFTAPRSLRVPYDPGEEHKGMVTVNWLLAENSSSETTLALSILGYILVGTPASPLRKALIDSGLGEDLTGGGLDDQVREMYFSTGLKGIDPDSADTVAALIMDTLAALVRDGIEADMVAAALNTVEFRLREFNTGGFPRGLAMMLSALSTWLYDADPLAPLAFEAPLAAIKARLAAGERYFEGLIADFLLNNPHRTTVLLEPEPGLGDKLDAEEQARLAAARAAMSDELLRAVIANTQRLKLLQETPDTPEALATIPTLKLADLDKTNKLIPLAEMTAGGVPVLYHDLFTNGIAYVDVGLNLRALPQEYLPYVSLFSRALLEIGTETEDYVTLAKRIGRKTGGIRPASLTSTVVGRPETAAWLFLRGKGTMAQTADLLDILRDVLLTANFDNRERFRQMLLEEKAGEEAGLVPAGHRVVHARLRAQFTEADWAAEQMGGISYLLFLRALAEKAETDWPAVVAALDDIRRHLLNRTTMVCNVTLDADNWARFQPQLAGFMASLPTGSGDLAIWQRTAGAANEGLTIPAQVNYVAKGANLYDLGYTLHGSALVITSYLGMSYLWEKIRVQGGAYGGFAVFDRHSGVFDFLSYRDPNLLATLDSYDGAARFLRELDVSRDEVTKGIIGTIGSMDAYQLPDAKGYTSMARHLTGVTDADRQRLRDEVLATTADHFRQFGDVLAAVNQAGHVVVMGSKDAVEEANAQRAGFLKVTKVL